MSDIQSGVLLELTVTIVKAYVSRNAVPVAELSSLLQSVHGILGTLAMAADTFPLLKPAVSIKRSVTHEYLICPEDGGKFKTLKRYLRARYDLTPGMAMAFAASYPERVHALALYGAFAKREWAPDYPWGPKPEARQCFYDEIERGWGGPVGLEDLAPSLCNDQAFREWWATYLRRSASPAAALALARMNALIDVRAVLPSIRAPALVMHRSGDKDVHIDEGRYIAARIPMAKFVEHSGEDHLIYAGDSDAVLGEVRNFVRDLRSAMNNAPSG